LRQKDGNYLNPTGTACQAKNPANCRYHGPIVDNEIFAIRHKLNGELGKLDKATVLSKFVNETRLSDEAIRAAAVVVDDIYNEFGQTGDNQLYTHGIVNNLDIAVLRRKQERLKANRRVPAIADGIPTPPPFLETLRDYDTHVTLHTLKH
jgi:hypothetical protein